MSALKTQTPSRQREGCAVLLIDWLCGLSTGGQFAAAPGNLRVLEFQIIQNRLITVRLGGLGYASYHGIHPLPIRCCATPPAHRVIAYLAPLFASRHTLSARAALQHPHHPLHGRGQRAGGPAAVTALRSCCGHKQSQQRAAHCSGPSPLCHLSSAAKNSISNSTWQAWPPCTQLPRTSWHWQNSSATECCLPAAGC